MSRVTTDEHHAHTTAHGLPRAYEATAHAGSAVHRADGNYEGHDKHAGHSVEMFRQKFWGTVLLSIPTVVWAPMIQHWFGYAAPGGRAAARWIPAIFGSLVFAYGGWVFIRGAAGELANRARHAAGGYRRRRVRGPPRAQRPIPAAVAFGRRADDASRRTRLCARSDDIQRGDPLRLRGDPAGHAGQPPVQSARRALDSWVVRRRGHDAHVAVLQRRHQSHSPVAGSR